MNILPFVGNHLPILVTNRLTSDTFRIKILSEQQPQSQSHSVVTDQVTMPSQCWLA